MRNRFKYFFVGFRQKPEQPDLHIMTREDFYQILRRYLRGHASPEEKRIVDAWYYRMGDEEQISTDMEDELRLEKQYWSHVRSHIVSTRPSGSSMIWMWSVGLAASAIFIVLSYFNISYGSATPFILESGAERTQIVYERIENKGDVPEVISLPDGSKVTLEPRSKIKFSSVFSTRERKVYLDGKAFFDVVPDHARPFKVFTKKIITRVLGTSFMVSAFRWEKDVTVEVRTGKVSVITKQDYEEKAMSAAVILTPNQQFVYNSDEEKISKGFVKEPRAVLPVEEVRRMRFEETSPSVVFEAIEKAYGVDIVYDREKFSSCRITTSISDGNIFNRLLIICEVINATYRLEEGKIIIEGEGCYSNL